MNNLSWLIYAADVAGSMGFLFGLGGLILLLGGAFMAVDLILDDEPDSAKAIFRRWWIPMSMLLLATIIPSSKTVYAIAASEMGEEALKSPVATKAMKALDAWLDRQIDDGKSND